MSEQVWKYLPHVPSPTKKPANINLKKKSEVTDKEVLNLTGGLFPLKLVEQSKNDHQVNENHPKWLYVPIYQKNSKIGPIYHWVKDGDEKKLYHGQKFNVETQVVTFTEQEFNQISFKMPSLTYSKAVELFELMQTYNLNFIVVQDKISDVDWSIEDLKEIYFTISKEILQRRNKREHPLATYIFDKKYQSNRKYELEKYMMRNKNDNEREKNLIAEIRKLQILLKKEEREQINLKKALKLEQVPEEMFNVDSNLNVNQIMKSQKVYSRQQYLSKPLNLPGKINDRLAQVLHGMSIPEKIFATEENTDLFDKLRQKILLMFSVQRYIRKKENQRRTLEEKKKRLISQEEDEKKANVIKMPPESLPKKKIHTNKS